MKRLATLAFGNILAVVNLTPQHLLKRYRTDYANSNPLATPQFAARRTWSLSRTAGFLYRFGSCFFASMPDSFVLSRQKTQIEAIRLFRVYTNSKMVAFSEKCRITHEFTNEIQCRKGLYVGASNGIAHRVR